MEFRVFLPVLKAARKAGNELLEKYDCMVLSLLKGTENFPVEDRTDKYIGGSNKFGLKFRGNNEKLELKVQQLHTLRTPGVECYDKVKLGKLEVTDPKFVKKVLRALVEMGNSDSENENILNNPTLLMNCLSIRKLRTVKMLDGHGVSEEICKVYSNDSDSNFEYWISIAYEGDLDMFFNSKLFLDKGVGKANSVWECLDIANQVNQSCGYDTIPAVIGGYPTWVNYMIHSAKGSDNAQLVNQVQHQESILQTFIAYSQAK